MHALQRDIEEDLKFVVSDIEFYEHRLSGGVEERMRIGAILMLAAGVCIFLGSVVAVFFLDVSSSTGTLVGMIGGGVSVFLSGSFYLIQKTRRSSMQARLDFLNSKRDRLLNFASMGDGRSPEERTTASYFDSLVRINVENLEKYYDMVKRHTDKSFTVSIVAGSVGFLLIGVGLAVGFAADDKTQSVAYIATGAGVVTEFIAGVFFFLYNRTVQQLKDYHDSLLAVQNILLSFKIVGDIKKESDKVKMVAQMLSFLVGGRQLASAVGEADAIEPGQARVAESNQ